MHPILFTIPGLDFPLRSFGVAIVCAFLFGHWVWKRLLLRYGQDPERDAAHSWDVAMWILLGAIAGGRALYVIVELCKFWFGSGDTYVGQGFAERPWEILFLWKGGLVMYGGFFGAVLLGVWAARKNGLKPLPTLDLGLIGGFCGQAVGRWGCYLVGDDYGREVPARHQDLPFPITLRVPDLAWLQANPASLFEHELAGKVLWATQIWMSVSALIVAGLGYLVLRRRRYGGQVALWVFLVYAINRFAIEAFRGDSVRGLWFDGALSTSQLLSLPIVAAAAWLLWKNRARTDPALA